MAGKNHVLQSAALRGRGAFADAVAEVENNRAAFDEYTLIPALLQAFYAADEGGLHAKAKALAKEIVEQDPDIPSIKKYL